MSSIMGSRVVAILTLTSVISIFGMPPMDKDQERSSNTSKGIEKLRDMVITRTAPNTNTEQISHSLSSLSTPDIDSLHLRPRIISLNIMVAGLSGLGKTTMCTTLLQSLVETEPEKNNRGRKHIMSKPIKTRSTIAIDESRQFEKFDPNANTILRVRIIDTPGFGNRINHKYSVKPIAEYIERCRHNKYKKEISSQTSITDYMDSTEDQLIHVCLYFLSPGRFLEIDKHFLKKIQREIPTIVPIIAKADTLTDDEIRSYRAELSDIFKKERIKIYNFDNVDSSSKYASNKLTSFDRGRRPGEVLAIISRDGVYPWGQSYSFNQKHSDLQLIRDLLLSQHTERFVESALMKYTEYRSSRITRNHFINLFKFVLLAGIATLKSSDNFRGEVSNSVTKFKEILDVLCQGFRGILKDERRKKKVNFNNSEGILNVQLTEEKSTADNTVESTLSHEDRQPTRLGIRSFGLLFGTPSYGSIYSK